MKIIKLLLICFILTPKINCMLSHTIAEEMDFRERIIHLMENNNLNEISHICNPVSKMAYDPKNLDVLKLLLERGANSNICSKKLGESPLHVAVNNSNSKAVRILLKYHANANYKGLFGRTALQNLFSMSHTNYNYEDIRILRLLLQAKTNVNIKDRFGDTALILAIKRITLQPRNTFLIIMLNMLLSHGADPYIKNYYGYTAIDVATQADLLEIAQYLEESEKILSI